MINASIRADIPVAGIDAESGYLRVERIISAMSKIVPELRHWYGGINTPQQKYVEFADKPAMMERVNELIQMNTEKFATLPQGFSMILASDTKSKRTPGLFELSFEPLLGTITLDITEPDTAFSARAPQIVRDALRAVSKLEDVQYAFIDVLDRVPDKPRPTTYRVSYATFPHRKCIGWMGFVPEKVTAEQLPSAAELIDIPRKGTVIVAVNEPFDLNNKAHIKQANIVEMELVDLGLLPVTDPTLM